MAVLELTINDELKKRLEYLYKAQGIDLPTAIRMFFEKTIEVGGMPFEMDDTLKTIALVDKMRSLSEENGNCEMTLDEIDEEIRLARLEK